MSLDVFQQKYPQGKVPRNSPDHGKIFVCRRGCNTRTATYTDEFVWEDLYGGAEDIQTLVDLVKNGTKATRRKRVAREESPDALYDAAGVDDDIEWGKTGTPKKFGTPKKPRSTHGTPRKSKPVTPSSHRKYVGFSLSCFESSALS